MSLSSLIAERRFAEEMRPAVVGVDPGAKEGDRTVYMERLSDGTLVVLDVTHPSPENSQVLAQGLRALGKQQLMALALMAQCPQSTSLATPTTSKTNRSNEQMQQLRANVLGRKGRW